MEEGIIQRVNVVLAQMLAIDAGVVIIMSGIVLSHREQIIALEERLQLVLIATETTTPLEHIVTHPDKHRQEESMS